MISLVIISGRSGSGKSTALHVLEDQGYYCIDNLPVSLLKPLIEKLSEEKIAKTVCVSIDARNVAADLAKFPEFLSSIQTSIGRDKLAIQIIYLDASSPTLVKRFSETRRKHPLSSSEIDLREALERETKLLDPISSSADLNIDTTSQTIHELRDLVATRITGSKSELAILIQSFAFKSGVPVDVDLVFDVRCLPNPHWVTSLRSQTGLDEPVQAFLNGHEDFIKMFDDVFGFLEDWLPKFKENNRSYMTIGIGCTGGQHRSVYLSEKIHKALAVNWPNVQVRHRELSKTLGH